MKDVLMVVALMAYFALIVWVSRNRVSTDSATEIIKASVGPMWTSYQVPIDANPWVSVTERLPELDRLTMVWGDELKGNDRPEHARRCVCHGRWVPERCIGSDDEPEDEAAEHLTHLVGNVTHWLDWKAPAGTEE